MELKEIEVRVTDSNFKQEVLDAQLPVLVDFWAPWCAPCNMIAPTVKKIAEKYSGRVKVCKLNVDEGRDIASTYGIRGIPTLMFFKDGNPVDTIVGVVSESEIEAKIPAVWQGEN
ncbi:MAG: thioredoxin [Candidatus Omnitrophica bacterium]|nr:thioredoxin [Candidatus Omnitrophota bacterium]MDD5429875.1 thioredoxin [Candidatus Omnitrophota bacterium]